MVSLMNKKRYFESYYFDPSENKTFFCIFKRNDFRPANPLAVKQEASSSEEILEKKLSLKENVSNSDLSSCIPVTSAKNYAMSYCSNLSSKKNKKSFSIIRKDFKSGSVNN